MDKQQHIRFNDDWWMQGTTATGGTFPETFVDILRDKETGLPMHCHGVKINDLFYFRDPEPCRCGDASWNMPLSAMQGNKVTGEDSKQ